MIDPELYNASSKTQRRDAGHFLQANSHHLGKFQSPKVIDVGCGDGFVTAEVLGKHFTGVKLLGVDNCDAMLNFANKKYGNAKCSFTKLDIDEDLEPAWLGEFDVVTSFYCFHWVKNIDKTLQNIYNLMKDGGMCLLCFPVEHPSLEVFKAICEDPKWEEHRKGAPNRFPVAYNVTQDQLKKAGFQNIEISVNTKEYEYTDIQKYQDLFMAGVGFRNNLSPEEVQICRKQGLELYEKSPCTEFIRDSAGNIQKIINNYKLMCITAFK